LDESIMETITSADSLKKRYFAKLSTNFASLAVNIVIQATIPRGLGPRAYGDFNFLSSLFTRIVNALDMGTSACFYTKLSQRQNDLGLVSFYLSFSGIIAIILLIFTGVTHASST